MSKAVAAIRNPGWARRAGRMVWTAAALAAASGALGGCSWLHFGSQDDDSYDYRKSKPRQEPLEVPPDLSQLPKDDRYALPQTAGAANAANAAASGKAPDAAPAAATAANPAAAAGPVAAVNPAAAGPIAAAGVVVAPSSTEAHIVHDGNERWLVANVSPEVAYTTIKDMWTSMGYTIKRDEPLLGLIETDWSESHPLISEDALRNALHKALGAFDSTGDRYRFRARIERTANNTCEITITDRAMTEVLQGPFKDTSKWEARPADPELEAEMLQRLALRFAPAQPLRVAVATGSEAAPGAPAAVPPAPAAAPEVQVPSRVHLVASGGTMNLQVEDSVDHTWRRVGIALDRGGFTIEERRRDKNVFAVRYLDPEYEQAEREKKSWWDRVFNSDASIPEQQFLIALSANGAATMVQVQDKDGHPDGSATAKRILNQLMDQLR